MENFYCRIILWLSCMLLSFVLLTLSQYFPVWPSTQSLSTCIYYQLDELKFKWTSKTFHKAPFSNKSLFLLYASVFGIRFQSQYVNLSGFADDQQLINVFAFIIQHMEQAGSFHKIYIEVKQLFFILIIFDFDDMQCGNLIPQANIFLSGLPLSH